MFPRQQQPLQLSGPSGPALRAPPPPPPVGRQGDGWRRPEVTLTLELRLPKGCEADRFPRRNPEPVWEGCFHYTSSRLWPWKFHRASEGTALGSLHWSPHLGFFLLPRSLIYCRGTPAVTSDRRNCPGKGHLLPSHRRL